LVLATDGVIKKMWSFIWLAVSDSCHFQSIHYCPWFL
jgi:hypothetical protein